MASRSGADAVRDDPPVPLGATTLDDLAATLRALRAWGGDPSYSDLARAVVSLRARRGRPEHEARVGRITVYDCFRDGRSRLDVELVADLVEALGADAEQRAAWREAVRRVQRPGSGPAGPAVVRGPAVAEPFLGRAAELERLLSAGSTTVAAVVEGMPGAGKTALAVLAARARADRWPDGEVVLCDLQGHRGDTEPAEVYAVVDALLGALRPGPLPPAGRRLRALHDLLAASHVVLVLDDVREAGQVVPLLAPALAGRLLLTSRQRLGGLGHAAVTTVRLGPLPPPEATDLLVRVSGRRPDDDPPGAAQLAALAGGLPLALALLGARVAARPDWSLSDHLAAQRARLALLHLDDGLGGSIGLSYCALDPHDQRLLRALGSAPARPLAPSAAAALVPTHPDVAAAVERLVDAHLVHRGGDGRLDVHDLVAAFARAQSLDLDPPSVRREDVERLCGYYVRRAAPAVATLHPQAAGDWWWDGAVPPATGQGPDEQQRATRWLDTERDNLLACADWSAQHGRHELCLRLAAVLAHDLWQRGDLDRTLEVHRAALAAATALGDTRGEALACRNVANTLLRGSRFDQARPFLDRARDAFGRAGDELGELSVLSSMAYLASSTGADDEAVAVLEDLVRRTRSAPDAGGARLALLLTNLGVALIRAGRRTDALPALEESAELSARRGWDEHERAALSNMVGLLVDAGRPADARRAAERSCEMASQAGDLVGLGHATSNLGVALAACGRHDEAEDRWTRALQLLQDVDAPDLVASVLNHQGDTRAARGDTAGARTAFEAALALAGSIGEATEARRARAGLEALG